MASDDGGTRTIRDRFVPLAAAACLLSLAACAAEPEPPLDPGLRLDRRPLVLPLDAYHASPEEEAVVLRARTELFRGCMARLGFTAPTGATVTGIDRNHERYLLEDERLARTRGYHPSEAPRAGPQRVIDPGYLAAANGTGRPGAAVPPGGCEAEAHDRLIPVPAAEAMRRVTDLKGWSWERSLSDSRVTGVFAAWSSCMARLGHDYPTPRAANNDVAFRTDRPTPREIATAVADVRCKRRTDVVRTWAAVEAAYQQQAIARHLDELREGKKAITSLVAASRAIARQR
ncbi:hypothetical protein [Nonomuraea harbinensis]|uniref:hypothetical protein n=1 Tax=Nonomuraea harbinensis TaxID=1286938 RepID=UPI001C5D6DC2|nr:hypothetical protein [Nonomuraea harbinensis]